ncbi:MAG TPA: ABC transporter permease [Gordonia polyisoprenivorans]|uniref:Cell division protein FtsX n=1 Tax=Gordonia polyisoprenivorans TaxID=84595 RepID=A0A846WTN9_9ACTN|nr:MULTISPECIES: permease-like cell division protein FtsX [Gordonia]MDF3284297.1 permease-like cell division protein FtsX [Gordonia sp. N1V]NKY04043.1 ABC transporter permease [Gordonia polyisoprenivorans]OPX14232.1 ABC transporter permease [Gordonia sp. i37]OZC31357.1 ABC transporter permease [Gordonia polyisoprenivorans]QTI67972.1 permease-like cell division protein FtsX [Gordonia polyisoprenivorans]
MRAQFIFSEVFNGFRRNLTMTVAMIITTAITLGMFGGGLLVIQMADKSQKIFLDRVEMQFFLNEDVSKADANCRNAPCTTLRADLEKQPGVGSVTYVSPEEGYQQAKEMFEETSPEIADQITQDTFSQASFKVRMSDPDRFDDVYNAFSGRQDLGVEGALDQRELVKRIFGVLDGVRNAAFSVAAILAVAAILLIVNTVQIAAFTRRTEVSIMRLVGATRWYTQLPFLLEAMLAAFIGSLLAIGGLFLAKLFFFDRALAGLYGVNIVPRVTIGDVLFVSPWLVIGGIVLAAVTGYVTLRVYVRE